MHAIYKFIHMSKRVAFRHFLFFEYIYFNSCPFKAAKKKTNKTQLLRQTLPESLYPMLKHLGNTVILFAVSPCHYLPFNFPDPSKYVQFLTHFSLNVLTFH
jgi:hypothetical protein